MNRNNFIPIVKSSGLYLSPASESAHIERFFAGFQSAWAQIPLCDRRAMVAFWRQRRKEIAGHPHLIKMTPEIWLAPMIVEKSSACVRSDGYQFRFDSSVFDYCDEERMAAIIGHEFGHIRSFIDDWYKAHKCEGVPCRVCEDAAFEYTLFKWGFPDVQSVWKTATCLRLDRYAKNLGLNGRVFIGDAWLRTYLYLPPNDLWSCGCPDDSLYLGGSAKDARKELEIISRLNTNGELAWAE